MSWTSPSEAGCPSEGPVGPGHPAGLGKATLVRRHFLHSVRLSISPTLALSSAHSEPVLTILILTQPYTPPSFNSTRQLVPCLLHRDDFFQLKITLSAPGVEYPLNPGHLCYTLPQART